MRAVRVHAFGRPPRLDQVPPPDPPAAGEVTIAVAAAGVGAWDPAVASGRLARFVKRDTPFVLGAELTGRVAALGHGVEGLTVGERVIANPGIVGAWAERVTIAADSCGRAPETVDDATAAALPVGALTAWQALDLLDVPEGSVLLVLGAGGSVGSAAVQLAAARGLRTLAIAGARDLGRLRERGAEAVHDYRGDWVDGLRPQAGDGVDGVLDLVGGETLDRSAELVQRGGRVVTTMASAEDAELPRDVTVGYLRMRSETKTLNAIADRVDEGRLAVGAVARYPLRDVERALGHASDRNRPGKAVLIM